LKRCGKNFRNFYLVDCKILVFEVTKILLEGFAKNQVVALHKVTFVLKKFPNGGAYLDEFFKSSWLHA